MNDVKKEFLKDDILKVLCGYFSNARAILDLRDELVEVVEKYIPEERRD